MTVRRTDQIAREYTCAICAQAITYVPVKGVPVIALALQDGWRRTTYGWTCPVCAKGLK
ncbi:MAG: hypothetical protein FWD75_03255 [Propionibacteriaceae bacterium]|nr:hypothetical protein [Propionibacteriaceae bacterium]